MMKKSYRYRLSVLIAICLVLSVCLSESSSASAAPVQRPELNLPRTPQVIGTHGSATWFYLVGSGIASVVSDHSGMRAMVQPYAGPSAWIPDLASGAISFGVISYTEAAFTYFANFEGVPVTPKMRQVMRGNTATNIGWIAAVDSEINKLSDMRGKVIAGSYGGTLFTLALLTAELDSVGLTWDDVTVVPVSDVSTGLVLLGEGTVLACSGGTATQATTVELDRKTKLQILPFGELTPEDIKDGVPDWCKVVLERHLPGTTLVVQQPMGIQMEPTVVYSYPMMLASSTNISDDVVYAVLAACYDHNAELVQIDNWLRDWTIANMFDPDFPLPYHNGAIRFYKELGLWDDAAQARQDYLLALMGEE